MDRLSRAEAALAAAAAHGPAVLVPGRVTSPMDSCRTVPVAREVVEACQARAAQDLDADTVLDPEMRRLSAGNARRARRDPA